MTSKLSTIYKRLYFCNKKNVWNYNFIWNIHMELHMMRRRENSNEKYAEKYENLRDVLMAIKRGEIPEFPKNVSRRAIQFLEEIYIVD